MKPAIPHNNLIVFTFLDTVGDGSGTKNAIGDYSGAPVAFKIVPPAGHVYAVYDIHAYLRNGGPCQQGKYGQSLVLTNGVKLKQFVNSVEVADYLDGMSIMINADWTRHGFTIPPSRWGTNSNFMQAVGNLPNFGRQPVILIGDNGDSLQVILEDDFTGLDEHYFQVRGFSLMHDRSGNRIQ